MRTRKIPYVVVAAMLALALVVPGVALADTGATRTLPATVAPGASFDVGLQAMDYGTAGQISETLPTGFTYQSVSDPSIDVSQDDGTVTFTFLGDDPMNFTYTVTAPAAAGSYDFAGVMKDFDKNEYVVGGDTTVTVGEAEVAATRTLPDTVEPEAAFDVGIDAMGHGAMGQVVETLPAGFTYQSVSAPDDIFVAQDGSVVTFTFLDDPASFTYSVMAPAGEDTYDFAGVFNDEDAAEYPVGGDTELIVEEPVFEETFEGTLEEKDRDCPIVVIPAGAINLDIQLSATGDLDLELYDGGTQVIGDGGQIDDAPGGTYEGDAFEYSGYDVPDEFIMADGPLGRAYDLCVFGYEAGDYTMDVYYEMGEPGDVTPPAIEIDVAPTTPGVGDLVAVTVTVDDASGVAECDVTVTGPTDVIAQATSFGDEVSISFVPGEAGTYTVDATAEDKAGNPADTSVDFDVT